MVMDRSISMRYFLINHFPHPPQFAQMMTEPMDTLTPEEELRDAFKVFDTDNDGYITKVRIFSFSVILSVF